MVQTAGSRLSDPDQCRAAVLCSHAEGQSGARRDRSDRGIFGDQASGGAQSSATRAIISVGREAKPQGQGEGCRKKGCEEDEAYRPEVAAGSAQNETTIAIDQADSSRQNKQGAPREDALVVR